MSAHTRCANAHSKPAAGGRVSALCLALTLGSALAAQVVPTPDTLPPALAAAQKDLLALLEDRDAEVRGEAALALAMTSDSRYYTEILAIAKDRSQDARLRGIIALGYLGAPGAESFLGQLLRKAPRRSPERAAAALALGLLPDQTPVPALHRHLEEASSGYKAHLDTLKAWLAGVGQEAHPSFGTRVQSILEDDSNRYPDLRRLAMRALATMPDRFAQFELSMWLESPKVQDRIGAIDAAIQSGAELTRADLDALTRTAQSDRDPAIRAAALKLLTDQRHLPALEVGVRALRSNDPREVAAGVRTARLLGGGAIRAAVESQILATDKPDLQAAMLVAYDVSVSADFLKGCLLLAADRRAHDKVRVEAAALLARSGDSRCRPILRALFASVEDPEQLRSLARAMDTLDPSLIALDKIFPPSSVTDLRLLPARMSALLASSHPASGHLLCQVLQSREVDDATKAKVIRGLRTTVAKPFDEEVVLLLPRQLQPIL